MFAPFSPVGFGLAESETLARSLLFVCFQISNPRARSSSDDDLAVQRAQFELCERDLDADFIRIDAN